MSSSKTFIVMPNPELLLPLPAKPVAAAAENPDSGNEQQPQKHLGHRSLFLLRHDLSEIISNYPFCYMRSNTMKDGMPGSFLKGGKTKKIFTYEVAGELEIARFCKSKLRRAADLHKDIQDLLVANPSKLPESKSSYFMNGPLAGEWEEACQNDLLMIPTPTERQTTKTSHKPAAKETVCDMIPAITNPDKMPAKSPSKIPTKADTYKIVVAKKKNPNRKPDSRNEESAFNLMDKKAKSTEDGSSPGNDAYSRWKAEDTKRNGAAGLTDHLRKQARATKKMKKAKLIEEMADDVEEKYLISSLKAFMGTSNPNLSN